MKKDKINLLIILIILISAMLLRFYRLGNLPMAFAFDEAGLGYNAWSILTTGKDEWGKVLPLTLRSFDDYKPAVYSYLVIPAIAISGLSQMTTRLPAAVFGSLLPVFVYLFLSKQSKSKLLGFVSAIAIVVAPWHIEISRTAIEAGVALSLVTLSFYLLSLKKEFYQYLGIFLVLLSLFTYHSARLLVPLFLLVALFFKVIKLDKIKVSLLLSLFILGMGLSLTSSGSRFAQISFMSDRGAELKRDEAIREDGVAMTGTFVSRVFHNKPMSWFQSLSDSYITNTSLEYLFLGGAQPQRVTIPETGQFLIIWLPFFILGLAFAVRSLKKIDKLMLFWLVVSPLPAAITTAEIPHTYRTIFMMLPIAYFIGKGTSELFLWSLKKWQKITYLAGFGLALAVLFLTAKAWHQYSIHQQLHQPWYRQYGYQELIDYLNTLDADHITMTNRTSEPYIYYLFYNKIEPKVYLSQPNRRLSHKDIEAGAQEWHLFEYSFNEEPCPYDETDTNPNNFYVVTPQCETPVGYLRIKEINFEDGNPAFAIERPVEVVEDEIN